MLASAPKIVVAGDVCIDWLAAPVIWDQEPSAPGEQVANWKLKEGTKMFPCHGGAWLLADMIVRTTGLVIGRQRAPTPLEHQGCDTALHSIVDLKPFPYKIGNKDHKKDVWRVDRFRGFSGPVTGSMPPCLIPTEQDDPKADMVVLDDVGNGFRYRQRDWPAALTTDGHKPIVVWKLARPFGESALLSRLKSKHCENTIVVLDVDDLRAEGAPVSRQLSWESTVGQLMHSLVHDPRFPNLRQFKHFVIRLDLESALYLAFKGDQLSSAEVTYLPAGIEGSTRLEFPGRMLGLTSVFVANLVAKLAKALPDIAPNTISDGIRVGITESRYLFERGFGSAGLPVEEIANHITIDSEIDSHLQTVQVAPLAGFNEKSRLIDYVRREPLYTHATQIVMHGVRADTCAPPIAKFGALETLDRGEIEAFRGIRNLIGEYLALPKPERPLSIAVFGPPGSGKSFGVSEIAKSLGDVEKIEFNVSQYESGSQLTSAFHIVRDAVVRGKVPLVFFDEFDAGLRGESLAWLKHFLAPMQDGKFTDGESTHHIGKAIFVFAGGTKHTYEEFAGVKVAVSMAHRVWEMASQVAEPEPDKEAGELAGQGTIELPVPQTIGFADQRARELAEENREKFVSAKGPDFVSRLRGFINVRGTDKREADDEMYVVRRAIVLRSLLERKAPQLLDRTGSARIDGGVLRAYLSCSSFRHGPRSMEAIIDMSQLSGRVVFERACLPSFQQLSLHVDAQEFMELVNFNSLNEHQEEIAQAIHEYFRRLQLGKKDLNDDSMKLWADLGESYRNSNRAQADDIPRKLSLVKCNHRPAKTGETEIITFTRPEVEILAEAEHNRWNDEKKLNGFVYGPIKQMTVLPYTHPCLLPWADLPDDERQKDRDTSAAIPTYLRDAGFIVYRLDESG